MSVCLDIRISTYILNACTPFDMQLRSLVRLPLIEMVKFLGVDRHRRNTAAPAR